MCGLRITFGKSQQRVARLGRLVVEYVQAGAGEVSRDQGIAQVGLDHQAAARGVDQVRARTHPGQEVAIDHAARGIGQRQVQADHVRAGQQLVERQPSDAVLAGRTRRRATVSKATSSHAERLGAGATARPIRPMPIRPRVIPRTGVTSARSQPPSWISRSLEDDPPRQGQHECERLLGDALLVGARSDRHRDPVLAVAAARSIRS